MCCEEMSLFIKYSVIRSEDMKPELATIIRELRRGHAVVVQDDRDREHEADLVIAAEKITVKQMAFLIRWTSGIITVPMMKQRLRALQLRRLRSAIPSRFGTPMVMPIDFLPTTRGGVSAHERTATIRALCDPKTKPEELGRPGHIFPLEAHPLLLHGRQGHTEATIALLLAAHMQPIGVIGELMNDDGTMMRSSRLQNFCRKHHFVTITIRDIIRMTTSQ